MYSSVRIGKWLWDYNSTAFFLLWIYFSPPAVCPLKSLAVVSQFISLETFLSSHTGSKPAQKESFFIWKKRKGCRESSLYFVCSPQLSHFDLTRLAAWFPLCCNSRKKNPWYLRWAVTKHTSRWYFCFSRVRNSGTVESQGCLSQKYCATERSSFLIPEN